MSSEWRLTKLGNLVDIKHGFAFKGEFFSEVPTCYQLTTPGNFAIGGGFQSEKVKYYNGPVPTDFVLNAGDLLVTMTDLSKAADTLGYAAKVPPTGGGTWLHNQRVGLVSLKSDASASKEFLHYLMRSPDYRHWVVSTATGSTVKHTSPSRVCDYEFLLPPIEVQKEIAATLDALDDRITLLRETNATLEAIAQALFKSWFVDFDPVRAKMEGRVPEGLDEATAALFPDRLEETELGLVPKGWRVMPVGDAIDTVGGATPDTKNEAFWDPPLHCWTSPKDLSGASAPVLLNTERRISDLGLNRISSGLLPAGSLLMSSRAPIGYLAIAQVPVAINQGYIGILPGGKLSPLFMLFWCRHNMDAIKGRANGSTFMEISKKAFRPIPALVPTSELLERFDEVVGALFARLVENVLQATGLAEVRDTLLPRLISGQLRLPEAQALLEDALA